ncbi:hypothetical protein ACFWDG_11960 [Peribacillus sp. NPDC060186]
MGNKADILPLMFMRGLIPDVLTDHMSAHDPLYGCYRPLG